MDMKKKKMIVLIGGIIAVALVCVLLVGMINGFRPWNGSGDDGSDYTGIQTEARTDDTDGTEDTTASESAGSTDTTKETDDKGGSGGNAGGNNGTGKGENSEGTTEATETTEPTDVSIGVEVDSTEPSGNGGSFEIDFDDLLG